MQRPPADRRASDPADGFVVERRTIPVEWLSAGPLVPWLGPAIRGIVALRFKDAVCVWPKPVRTTQWRYCRGCPSIGDCGYGRLFEPDGSLVTRGAEAEAIRAVVLAPAFPQPPTAVPGGRTSLCVTTIGPVEAGWIDGLLESLARAGDSGVLGPGGVRFRLERSGSAVERRLFRTEHFAPLSAADGGGVPVEGVVVDLVGPLFLRRRHDGVRTTLRDSIPFIRLLEIALRTVRQCGSAPLPRLSEAVMAAAAAVGGGDEGLVPFDQDKASRRSGQRVHLRGVTGSVRYRGVPRDTLPWLAAAGMIHVGAHRVAGAGGWRLRIDAGAGERAFFLGERPWEVI